MEKFRIGDRPDAEAELLRLFERNGFAYRREAEGFRIVFADGGCKWETVCVCREQKVLLYGLYPFPVRSADKAAEVCMEMNRQVIFGSAFSQGEHLIFRTCADLFDAYSAYESIGRALEYNASVMVAFWGRASAAGAASGSAP